MLQSLDLLELTENYVQHASLGDIRGIKLLKEKKTSRIFCNISQVKKKADLYQKEIRGEILPIYIKLTHHFYAPEIKGQGAYCL